MQEGITKKGKRSGFHLPVYFRPDGCVNSMVSADIALSTGTNCFLSFHFVPLIFDATIQGYRFSSKAGVPTPTSLIIRMATYTADPSTYLPKAMVANSLGTLIALDGNTQKLGAIGSVPYNEEILANSFKLRAGYYWIAVLAQGASAGGTLRGSSIEYSGPKGISDLHYTGATVANGDISTFSWPENILAGSLAVATGANSNGKLGAGFILTAQ